MLVCGSVFEMCIEEKRKKRREKNCETICSSLMAFGIEFPAAIVFFLEQRFFMS